MPNKTKIYRALRRILFPSSNYQGMDKKSVPSPFLKDYLACHSCSNVVFSGFIRHRKDEGFWIGQHNQHIRILTNKLFDFVNKRVVLLKLYDSSSICAVFGILPKQKLVLFLGIYGAYYYYFQDKEPYVSRVFGNAMMENSCSERLPIKSCCYEI